MTNSYFPHITLPQSRREFLARSGCGFGALALAGLQSKAHAGQLPRPHFAATAKSAIFLFMEGGPSHIDTFDPKPELNRLAGQQLPASYGPVMTAMGEANAPLLESKRSWKQYGESGIWVSDWLPYTAQCVDDIAVIRSCWTDGNSHSAGVCQMNTCSMLGGRPSLGSWVTYGLGSENQNLPAFVVMQDGRGAIVNGPRNWSAGFMPANYQGVHFSEGSQPIPNLDSPEGIPAAVQQEKLNLLASINTSFASQFPQQTELEARIRSYELAFQMQAAAPEAIDLNQETAATKELYGFNRKETESFGRQCLLARRLVERGVRFIQLYHGAGSRWDAHNNIESNHTQLCAAMDQPVAALLKDLKQRGLLDETLVVWGGEFGRTPMSEQGNGRDHNPTGFTMWMAGGGVKGGQTIGTTDELGLRAVEDRLHVHDLHASILHLLGLDHMALTYFYKGRPERPTANEGAFARKLVGG
ncbi:DUF1501 domain-containing protein [Planctomicrobium piriforme]|uniref:Tat (Twin-arginine translocation) pathway signal sequence n=1 Tax=Planctomicrobium piriforme TaxID=1576369 RepID=A0A1I3RZ50_9PLAN|nr:DUF1501 domain-containing protein [Planctomicrobium piriforme]SFJ50546.1 Tat (twin-arginine translocation) pathway signal sequence [Planctomicrobium piriforme]